MKNIFLVFSFLLVFYSIKAQNYDVRFNRTSVNCQTRQACYDVQIRPNGSTAFYLAGQNWRIYWDATKATFVSGTSVLPTPQYTAYTQVQLVENANADAKNGPLGFEANLSFLNYYMDLNNTNTGGILLPAGEWTTTSNLCFTVAQEVIDNPGTCMEMVFGRETLTAIYATAYVEVSRWVSSGVTTNSVGVLYDDLNSSDGDQACFDTACGISGITIADVTVNENAGSATVQVCIPTATTSPVTVTLNTGNGTAVSPQDYTTLTNVLVTIPAGQTCTPVIIPITDDAINEGTELFNVTLSNPSSNASIADGSSTVTINDNESAPTVSINDVTINESAGTATLTVTLSGASSTPVTMVVNTSNDSAGSGTDYTSVNSVTVTIPAGSTTATVIVDILNDTSNESTENFNVNLSGLSSNATFTDALGTVTILDDDAVVPSITLQDITVNENAGSATVQVCIPTATTSPVTVTLNTGNGTAVSPQDYTTLTNVLVTIPAGQTCTPVIIPITDDAINEGTELFNVTLSNASVNATIGDGSATVSINDNDPACNAQAPVISGN